MPAVRLRSELDLAGRDDGGVGGVRSRAVVGGRFRPRMRGATEQLTQSALEHLVAEGVDERIDTAAGEHEHDANVVQRAAEVEPVAEVEGAEEDLIERPARDERGDDRHLRLEDVGARPLRALRLAGAVAAAQVGRLRHDGTVERLVHGVVAAEVDGGRENEDEEDRGQPADELYRLAAGGGPDEAAAAVVHAARRADKDDRHDPREDAGGGRAPSRVRVAVEDRVDDCQVALAGDRHQVVGGRDERAP